MSSSSFIFDLDFQLTSRLTPYDGIRRHSFLLPPDADLKLRTTTVALRVESSIADKRTFDIAKPVDRLCHVLRDE